MHVRPGRPAILVREGFAWGALFLGPLWLLGHRAWVAAVLATLALLGSLAAPPFLRPVLCPAVLLACGVLGHDALRGALRGAGYRLHHVVAAPDRDAAFLRLLDAVPGLREGAA